MNESPTPHAAEPCTTPPTAVQGPEIPEGVDRRAFLMRNAAIGAAMAMTGLEMTPEARAQQAAKEAAAPRKGSSVSPSLNVVTKSKGPVMTVLEEFYKVGPGPSSSHTIGPMRITYDFYQRCTKLPADQLASATGLKVHLFGSLSATGKGHGTERASLAGLIGKEPATVDPLFLDEMTVKSGLAVKEGVLPGPIKLRSKAATVWQPAVGPDERPHRRRLRHDFSVHDHPEDCLRPGRYRRSGRAIAFRQAQAGGTDRVRLEGWGKCHGPGGGRVSHVPQNVW